MSSFFRPAVIARVLLVPLLLGSCSPGFPAVSPSPSVPPSAASETSATVLPAVTSSAPALDPSSPSAATNPLTGLPVEDPSLLQVPAALVSISHFPVEARPQAGLSFAPYVFEIYITEGATRFLTTFYGEFPAPEAPLQGDCEVRQQPFHLSNLLLGNRVWHDENGDGLQQAWENGIGGVCVNLYDEGGRLLQQTTTDSNGYYGFNVVQRSYLVEVARPAGMQFAPAGSGDEASDSDVDPVTGRAGPIEIGDSLLSLDAGLIAPAAASELPPAKVGPVRSGRLVYADIAAFFPDSCLIYAFASAEVLVELPKCAFVEHDIQGGGYMLGISELIEHTKNSQQPGQGIDYHSNVYSVEPPEGGIDASKLHVYIAWLNQSAWVYDPLAESWWRYVDNADPGTAGIVHPEVDRLTGRQLLFENVIVLFAKHDVVSPTNLDIHLEQDWLGDALLFRDGMMYSIRWSTVATDEELSTGRRRPIRFLGPDEKTPFPLKPGQTWVLVVTPETAVTEQAAGDWLVQFSQPPGAK